MIKTDLLNLSPLIDLLSKIGSSSPNAFILILPGSVPKSIRVCLMIIALSLDNSKFERESPSSEEWPSNSTFKSFWLVINLNNHRLSLGLKLSGNDYNINYSNLDFDDLSDPNAGKIDSYFVENIGFGLYFQADKLYLGFSIPYFFESKKINKKRHYYLSGGFTKVLSD